MDFEKNVEFIEDYVESVIEDLGPMMQTLMEDPKYKYEEIRKIFFDHVSKTEYNRFCEIIGDVFGRPLDYQIIYELYEFIFDDVYDYDIYLESYIENYVINNEKVVHKVSLDIPQDGLAENFYINGSVKIEGDIKNFPIYLPIEINGQMMNIPIHIPNQ